MADTTKILGQSFPAAVTLTDAYTVPALTSAMVSSIIVCNQSATPTTFRISVAVAGAGDATKQYIAYNAPLLGNESYEFKSGQGLAASDVVRVYSASGNVSFNINGIEIT